MATIETELVAALAAVTASGGRVYPERWPQDVTFPAITYQLISAVPEAALNRTVGAWRDLYQIDCYAQTRSAVVTLSTQVQAALYAFHGTTINVLSLAIENVRDMSDPATQLRRRIVEVVIVHE